MTAFRVVCSFKLGRLPDFCVARRSRFTRWAHPTRSFAPGTRTSAQRLIQSVNSENGLVVKLVLDKAVQFLACIPVVAELQSALQ